MQLIFEILKERGDRIRFSKIKKIYRHPFDKFHPF